MKILLSSILILFVSLNFPVCSAQTAHVTLAFKIKHPVSDTLFLRNQERIFGMFVLGKKNYVRDTVTLPEGYYEITDNNEFTTLYLKDGFDLLLTLDTRQFDESVRYKGKGAAENNYLAATYLQEENFGKLNNYGYYAKLKEKDFLQLMDSMDGERLALLQKYSKGMDAGFMEYRKKVIEFEKRNKLNNYESMHMFLTGNKEFRVSDSFPDPFEGFSLSEERWIGMWQYTSLVTSCLEERSRVDLRKSKEGEYYLQYLKRLAGDVESRRIREQLAYEFGMRRMTFVKSKDSAYRTVMGMLSDPVRKEEVTDLYNKLLKTSKGEMSPDFSLADRNGKVHHLNDFKGKLVYIDVWATWCGPCIAEMPHMEKLQDSLKGEDIVFVSICKSDERASWEKFLDKKQPGGVQLFAEYDEKEFFDAYVIQGIPRFILLDREGRIVDPDAKRPSDPKLIGIIRSLLQESAQ